MIVFLKLLIKKVLKINQLRNSFFQDNEAFSKRKFDKAKLVRAVKVKILDSVVDLRFDLKFFGQHFSIILLGENKKQLFVSRGFAN